MLTGGMRKACRRREPLNRRLMMSVSIFHSVQAKSTRKHGEEYVGILLLYRESNVISDASDQRQTAVVLTTDASCGRIRSDSSIA